MNNILQQKRLVYFAGLSWKSCVYSKRKSKLSYARGSLIWQEHRVWYLQNTQRVQKVSFFFLKLCIFKNSIHNAKLTRYLKRAGLFKNYFGTKLNPIGNQIWFKTVQQHSRFWTEYFGETLFRPRWMVAEMRLTDPLPELAVSRSESYIFESSRPVPI